jgi:hypothetical protein
MLFSVGYTLPYDQSELIFSLSQVRNFLGDDEKDVKMRLYRVMG